jgi:LEA14-like dessication related protein
MKKYLPLYLLGAGAYLVYFLKNKARAGANLKYVPIDIAIDLKRSNLLNIVYVVKMKLINSENAAIVVNNINLNVVVEGVDFGNLSKTEDFRVDAQSEKIISFDASFSPIGALSLIRKIIQGGFNVEVNVNGFIDTDLGRINVDFKKKVGRGVNGICAPLNVKDSYFLFWKKNRQPVGTSINEVHDYILTCLNTGSKLYDFSIETNKGDKYDAPEFLKLLKSKGFLLSSYSLN